MTIGELHEYLTAVIDGEPKLKNADVFISIDWGEGSHSRIYEIDQFETTNSEDMVLMVKAYQQ